MGTQTRTWQRKIINAAIQADELSRLYWFVEMSLPSLLGGGYAAATYPVGVVPVVPVGPCPETQRHWAHLLLELFRMSNQGRAISFELALTDCDLLTAKRWYVYGESPPAVADVICAWCGEVFGPTVAHACMQSPPALWMDLRTDGQRWAVMPTAWMERYILESLRERHQPIWYVGSTTV